MVFASHIFLAFLLSVLLLFWASQRLSNTAGKYVLIFASLFFYGYWLPVYLILLILSICVNYLGGGVLRKLPNGKPRFWTAAAFIVFNIALIAYYKYFEFLLENINFLYSSNIYVPEIILPIGISFFTFQQVSYIVEEYKRNVGARNFVDYTLFISFFPQLIAGPIVTQQEMLPQLSLKKSWKLNPLQLALGLAIFAAGLFKKTVIIDPYVPYIDIIYERASQGLNISMLDGWTAALGYSFQIYFDFSAYSDMAIGLALMFGLHLPVNFNAPYKAMSIRDFWRRWHITLSRFLRDYIYIPLGGSKSGMSRTVAALLITMGLGGLWHGAGWTFVIWGLCHGALLALAHWINRWDFVHRRPRNIISRTIINCVCIGTTFTLVTILWVYFRADSVTSAHLILNGMFDFTSSPSVSSFSSGIVPLFPLYFCIVWLTPTMIQIFSRYKVGLNAESYAKVPDNKFYRWLWLYEIGTWRWAVASAITFILAWFLMSNLSPFIYFQF